MSCERLKNCDNWKQNKILGASPIFGGVGTPIATLTEFGEQLLAWRGVSSETVQAFLGQAGKFGDVIKLRKDLFELAGLARTIKFTGNDAQKADLTAAVATLSAAVAEAKKALYRTLADN